MKQTIVFILAALVFAACQEKEVVEPSGSEGSFITLHFENDPATRAFFDEEGTSEPWETELKTMQVLCFTSTKFIMSRDLTPEEITSKQARILLPLTLTPGENCYIFALANNSITGDMDHPQTCLWTEAIESCLDYNDAFDIVSTEAVRKEGFTMSWSDVFPVPDKGEVANINVELARIVAKVAVKTHTSDEFKKRYSGKVIITEAALQNAAEKSYLFDISTVSDGETGIVLTQTSAVNMVDESFMNLFYVYNLKPLPANKLTLVLKGYYDEDGDLSTDLDRKEIEYIVPIEGSIDGWIKRNAYYRLDLSIRGLNGKEVDSNIVVLDWDTITQTEDLGF